MGVNLHPRVPLEKQTLRRFIEKLPKNHVSYLDSAFLHRINRLEREHADEVAAQKTNLSFNQWLRKTNNKDMVSIKRFLAVNCKQAIRYYCPKVR